MDLRGTVERIVSALGEQDAQAREQIVAVVGALGDTAALELLDETMAVENNGGMLLADGSRRRTPGGVFFQLARRWLPADERKRIFGAPVAKRDAAPTSAGPERGTGPHQMADAPPSSTTPATDLRRRRIVAPSWQHGQVAEPTKEDALEAAARVAPRAARQTRRQRRQTRRSREVAVEREVTESSSSDGRRRHVVDELPAAADPLEAAIFELAHRFAISMVPLLREAMVSAAREALLFGRSAAARRPLRAFEEPAGDEELADETAEQTEIRRKRPSRQARRRTTPEPRGSVRKRVLEMLAVRPGMTVGELAMELYGEDDRRTRDRVKAVTYRLKEAGVIRGSGAEGFVLDGGEVGKNASRSARINARTAAK